MSRLRKVKRKNLDVEKYSKALNAAFNYRIYAEHWYLDILTDGKWECWILGDYEVVMPVPLQFKFGIKFVLQPIYCQQLGVFYKEEISDELFKEFENKIHKYRVRSYHFNEENTERYDPKGEKRVNHVLDLNRPYEEIAKNFSKSTKWNFKQFDKSNLKVFPQTNLESILRLKKQTTNLKLQPKLSPLLKNIIDNSKLINLTINSGNDLLGYGSFVVSNNRIIYINSATAQAGKKINAATGIMVEIIKQYANTNYLLDFEGSSIPPIEFFFKGFGGVKNYYTYFSNFRVKYG